MKYYGGAQVMVPWLENKEDGSLDRNWTALTFTTATSQDYVDRRRIKREIRKFVRGTIGRHIHIAELRFILAYVRNLGPAPKRHGCVSSASAMVARLGSV